MARRPAHGWAPGMVSGPGVFEIPDTAGGRAIRADDAEARVRLSTVRFRTYRHKDGAPKACTLRRALYGTSKPYCAKCGKHTTHDTGHHQ